MVQGIIHNLPAKLKLKLHCVSDVDCGVADAVSASASYKAVISV